MLTNFALPNVFIPFLNRSQFVAWKLNSEGKKLPINPITGKLAKANDNSTWTTYDKAISFNGNIGIELGYGLGGIDIDNCFDDNGILSDMAAEIVSTMNTYTEFSPSGKGLHLLFTYEYEGSIITFSNGKQGRRDSKINLELYAGKHFLTVTGKPYGELKPIAERTREMYAIYDRYLKEETTTTTVYPKKNEPVQPVSAPKVKHVPGNISEALITAQFFNSMNTCGIIPRETFSPVMDGETHRFAVARDKAGSTSGAYFIHSDDCPNWGVMDFHVHSEMQTFKFDFSVLDADTRREYLKQQNSSNIHGISGTRTITETQRKEIERKKQEKANAKLEIGQAALSMAFAEYNYADLFGAFSHPYLKERFPDKGIHIEHSTVFNSWDIRTNDEPDNYRPIQRMPIAISRGRVKNGICKEGEVIIPLLNVVSGELQSLIHIPTHHNNEGKFDKKYYTGLTIQGAAHILRPKFSELADCLFVCEGICTALAVLIDTKEKYQVFSVGSCHNLIHVCRGLRKRYHDKKIIIVADNDESGAGLKAAERCKAEGLADGIRMPEITGHDWYDRLITKLTKGI